MTKDNDYEQFKTWYKDFLKNHPRYSPDRLQGLPRTVAEELLERPAYAAWVASKTQQRMSVPDKGPFSVRYCESSKNVIIESDDFHHDARFALSISGDFYDLEEKMNYARGIACELNATAGRSGNSGTSNTGETNGSDQNQ